MLTNANKKDRSFFLTSVKRIFGSMGLKILESKLDYNAEKPDAVAIYPDKKKYYIIEALSLACFEYPYHRIYNQDINKSIRSYCKNFFRDSEEEASVAAAILCDLSIAIDIFNYKSLKTYTFTNMVKYGALVFPPEKTNIVSKVFDTLEIDYRILDILDDFTLILISKEDTLSLPERKKFINFIMSNQ